MPPIQPLLPFLRPLAPPKSSTCRQLLRFTAASRLRIEPQSSSPGPILPFKRPSHSIRQSTPKPNPKPKIPTLHPLSAKAQKLASAASASSTASSSNPTLSNPAPHSCPTSPANLPPPAYHVARSIKKNYPIYTDYKRGGNLHLTTVRKVSGDLNALKDELRRFLNKRVGDVTINALTKHVIVKGHHKPEIMQFLKARGM
ncbi:uncharacterized protein BDR25DRAFT_225956 [Lindgomyces ingoldianus]|uniref:Uncharacterized protein n=1 Tax=Lindgomyces ingoldianus TaxID=673940 RepID=A0ACB6QTM2_9PLEO|nr:uncharacterized protein BDR25DRAFT_225956 [Lindgomyces ingoldianus]KAF2470374.1 hypothetical protein BDR25DRAFT_225956 [Lindgomyces ingoldianus]